MLKWHWAGMFCQRIGMTPGLEASDQPADQKHSSPADFALNWAYAGSEVFTKMENESDFRQLDLINFRFLKMFHLSRSQV